MAYPQTTWGLGRRELTTLKRTTLLTLFKVFEECNITPSDYNYNQQLNTIVFGNGSTIFLIDTAYKPSDPNYTRFGGYELTGCGIDESAETDYKAIEILFTRTGRKNNHKYGLQRKMFETFNPDKGHVFRRYYKPYVDKTLTKEFKFVPALPKDNPSPEVDAYIEGILRTASEQTVQRLIYGNFMYDDTQDQLFEVDVINDMFEMRVPKTGNKYLSVDVARYGADKTVFCIWDGLTVEKVIIEEKKNTQWTANKIVQLCDQYSIRRSRVVIDEDGIGGGVVDQVRGVVGFVNNSRTANFANLKTQCYFLFSQYAKQGKISLQGLTMTQRDMLSEELQQIREKDTDKDKKLQITPKAQIKERLGRSPDISDTLMFRFIFELQREREVTVMTFDL